MKRMLGLFAGSALALGIMTAPGFAQLGGLLDINTDDGLSVDVLDDTATVSVGGGGGNVVDADVLPNDSGGSAASANVSAGGGSGGGVGANVDVLGGGSDDSDSLASVGVNVGRDDGLLDACVEIGGNCRGGPDGPDGPGPGPGPGPVDPGGPNGPGANNGGSSGGGLAANRQCIDARAPVFAQLASIDYSSRVVSSWLGATGVQFLPITLCPGLDGRLGSGLLAQVAASVPPLQAAFAQSSYSASNVVGIVRSGSVLNVYVN